MLSNQINRDEESNAFSFLKQKWEASRNGNLLDQNVCVGSGQLHLNLELLHNNVCTGHGLRNNACTGQGFNNHQSVDKASIKPESVSAQSASSFEGLIQDAGIEVNVVDDISHKMQILETSISDDIVTLTPLPSEDLSHCTRKTSNSTLKKELVYSAPKIMVTRPSSATSATTVISGASSQPASDCDENSPPVMYKKHMVQIIKADQAPPVLHNKHNVQIIKVEPALPPRQKLVLEPRSHKKNEQFDAFERLYRNRTSTKKQMPSISMDGKIEIDSRSTIDTLPGVSKSASYSERMKQSSSIDLDNTTRCSSVSSDSSSQENRGPKVRRSNRSRGRTNGGPPRVPIHERLYGTSKARQEEGKQRREAIAAAAAKRKEIPDFSEKTIPLSRAADFYHKSIKEAQEREERLAKLKEDAEKEKLKASQLLSTETVPLAHASDFYQKSIKKAHQMEERLHSKKVEAEKRIDEHMIHGKNCGTVSRSHAGDFYKRSVKRAIEEETKRALAARERKSNYEPLYKFNL